MLVVLNNKLRSDLKWHISKLASTQSELDKLGQENEKLVSSYKATGCVEANLVICSFRLLLSFLFETTSLCTSSCISLNAFETSSNLEFSSVSSMVEESSVESAIKHTFSTSSSLEELEDMDALSS